MSAAAQRIEADWTWTGERFESGVRIAVGAEGRIESVEMSASHEAPREADRVTRRLTGQALLPGFVNVHSHGFQRALRGRGETFPRGRGSFWSWREAMYQLVQDLDADGFYQWTRDAFEEMRSSGITSVGEFHYFRHDHTCSGFSFDDVLFQAAEDSGIRLALLASYYQTGGIGQPLSAAQRRFECSSPREFWRQVDRLAGMLRSDRQTIGAAVHSIRAAHLDDLAAIQEESRRRGLPFHMHVEEQPQEITDCRAAYGKTPMAVINERLEIDQRFTAVHCTHTEPADMQTFAGSGGNVCICPLTEANLGDGIPDLPGMRSAGARVCLGTDSNARISMIEEVRWLELGQRLRTQSRGVCHDSQGSAARPLLTAATAHGAAALNLSAGRICPGAWADFLTVDLNAPQLRGQTPDNLLDMIVFGAGDSIVHSVSVAGKWTGGRCHESAHR